MFRVIWLEEIGGYLILLGERRWRFYGIKLVFGLGIFMGSIFFGIQEILVMQLQLTGRLLLFRWSAVSNRFFFVFCFCFWFYNISGIWWISRPLNCTFLKFYLVKSCFLYKVSKFIACVCFLCLSLMIMKIDISYLAQILGCLCFGFAQIPLNRLRYRSVLYKYDLVPSFYMVDVHLLTHTSLFTACSLFSQKCNS